LADGVIVTVDPDAAGLHLLAELQGFANISGQDSYHTHGEPVFKTKKCGKESTLFNRIHEPSFRGMGADTLTIYDSTPIVLYPGLHQYPWSGYLPQMRDCIQSKEKCGKESTQ
jgi:hypothetical protein